MNICSFKQRQLNFLLYGPNRSYSLANQNNNADIWYKSFYSIYFFLIWSFFIIRNDPTGKVNEAFIVLFLFWVGKPDKQFLYLDDQYFYFQLCWPWNLGLARLINWSIHHVTKNWVAFASIIMIVIMKNPCVILRQTILHYTFTKSIIIGAIQNSLMILRFSKWHK